MGKNDGSHDDAVVVASGAAELVGVVFSSSVVPVGLVLTGRSGWSVGLDMRDVGVGSGVMAWVVPAMVVVEEMILSWSSSSCSSGIGRRVCLSASIASPQSLRCQSMKVPLCSLTMVSLTIIVQVPTPDSPLGDISIDKEKARGYIPMNNRHEGPIIVSFCAGIQASSSS